jgi:cell division protein FtsX
MYYLITQLWLFLLIAFVIGVATGWFTSGSSSDTRG